MPNNRTLLTVLGLICYGLIGVALYLQHVKGLLPCPLCVIQRYAFIFAGTFALLAAWTRPAKVWNALALVAALVGLGYVGKHLYVLAHPGFSCGIDPMETFLNKIPTATGMPWLFQADGLCENATEGVLGLSIPQWSAVWFVIVTITLLYTLLRRRTTR
ncbi:MAG: disulfide bond formation protein B [Gammaproteobacteria bacterium]